MSFASLRSGVPLTLLLAAACGGGNTSGSGGGGSSAGGAGGAAATSTSSTGTTSSSTAGSGGAATTSSSSASGSGGAPGCLPGTTQACYSGPSGTMNVGACKPGMQTCQADGTFGPCTGDVVPTAEDCTTLVDDNCNGATNEGCVCMPGTTASCYGGAPGTENVGICKAGTKTCADDGLSYGQCMGQVQPNIENCLSPEDEDCDGTAQKCTGNGLWAKRFGDAGAQSASAVANHLGGPVITGALAGAADFGGGALTSAGNTDVFVASYDYAGTFVWAKRFGDAGAQSGVDVAVDKQGNTIVIGDFAGAIDFGGGTLTSAGMTDVFVAKFDSGGAFLWAKRFGDNQAQNGRGVAVDDAGNVHVIGTFASKIDFGGGALTSAGGTDVFVAKLDPDGNHLWSKRFGDASAQNGKAVAVDLDGNVVITGDVAGVIDFGGGALTSAGGTDVFVASLNANGNHFWSKIFGNASNQTAGGLDIDSVGNVVITGNAAGKIDFGGGMLTSAGGNDVYVAKLTQAGMHLWSKLFGSAGAENGRDVAVDRFGGIVLTGDFATTINFGGTALTSAGGTDVFVTKLDPLGAHVWSRRYGDAQAQSGSGVTADETGVLVTGAFAGSIDFGPGALTSAGGNDVVVAKLAP
ncbi:MAG: SBBP repeat-containing protein [Minicystis sp.]